MGSILSCFKQRNRNEEEYVDIVENHHEVYMSDEEKVEDVAKNNEEWLNLSDSSRKFRTLSNKYKTLKIQFVKCSRELTNICDILSAKQYSYNELEALYNEHNERNVKASKFLFLGINCNNSRNRTLINKIQHRKLPEISGVRLQNISESIDEVNKFLKLSIPQNLKCLEFNFSHSSQVDGEIFIDSLLYTARNIKTNFSIYCTNLSNFDFCRLIKAVSHCKEVGFYSCNIDTSEECKFSEISNCNIQRLSLRTCGARRFSYWFINPERFSNILKGISIIT